GRPARQERQVNELAAFVLMGVDSDEVAPFLDGVAELRVQLKWLVGVVPAAARQHRAAIYEDFGAVVKMHDEEGGIERRAVKLEFARQPDVLRRPGRAGAALPTLLAAESAGSAGPG